MNQFAAWGPTAVAIVVAIFTYGKFTAKQDAHEVRLDDHDVQFKDHGQHLTKIDLALVRLEEYNRGFADATKLAHK